MIHKFYATVQVIRTAHKALRALFGIALILSSARAWSQGSHPRDRGR